MFLLLIACSANQSADSVTLAREGWIPLAPSEQTGSSYHVAFDSTRGCRSSEWLSSTLEDRPADFGSASSSGLSCQGLGMSWANTEGLSLRPEIVLLLNDWASSYPVLLGNWPTAPRNLVPDAPIRSGGLPGTSVGFDLEGPGVLNPELQVVVVTFDGTWLLPQDGGEVVVEDDYVEVSFPSEMSSPVELVFEDAWPATVLEGGDALPFALEFALNDGGQSFEIFAVD